MKRFVNVYILFFLLYLMQGTLFSPEGVLGRILLVLLLLSSLYYWVYAMMHIKLPKPLKVLSVLMIIWIPYGLWPMLFGMGQLNYYPSPFSALKTQFMSILPIFSFYVFARKEWLTEKMLNGWILVFVVVAVVSYFQNQSNILGESALFNSSLSSTINNISYLFVSLLPLLPLLWRKPALQYSVLFICLFFIIMGMKRGAFAAGIMSAAWMLLQNLRNKSGTRNSVLRVLLTAIMIAGAVSLMNSMMTNDLFSLRYEETLSLDSSGRDYLYESFYAHLIHDRNPVTLLFGNGAYGTLKISYNYAHNDWLEIAIDNGLIVLVIYLIYWINLVIMLFNGKQGSPTTIMLGMFVIIYFIRSLVSMSINDISIFAACAIGYSMANYEYRTTTRLIH